MTTPNDPTWSDAEIEARRNDLMPDVPVLPGIAEVDQTADLTAMAAARGTEAAMVQAAQALLGTSEHPPGSNHNFITQWYGIGDGSWCDMSVSYEAWKSGNAAAVGGMFAYCPSHTRWFLAHGEWKYGGGDLRPGDVVFYNWSRGATLDADHVGVIERVLSDGTFYALEGNTSDVFARRHRDHTYVAGRGRPHYAATPPTPTPTPATADDDCWVA